MPHLSDCLRLTAVFGALFGLQSAESRADAPAACHMVKIGQMPLTEVRDGVAIPVTLNGKSVLMKIGTAYPLTYLFKHKAKELGLVTGVPDETQAKVMPEGFELTEIDALDIGTWQAVRSTKVPVAEINHNAQSDSVAGILGEDFLKSVDIDLNLPENKIAFFRGEGCNEQSPPLAPESFGFIPFKLASPQYWSRVMFDVVVNGHPVKATIGTEHAHTRLTEEAATDLGVDLKAAQPIAATVSSDLGGDGLWMTKFDSFKLGDEEVKPVWLRSGGAGPETHVGLYDWMLGLHDGKWQMVLGRDFLKTHEVMISHSEKRLYYAYLGGPVFVREDNTASR